MEPGVWEEVGTAGGAAPQVCTDYPSGTCLALAGERRYMPACLPTSAMAALLPSLSWPAHAHPAPGCEGDPSAQPDHLQALPDLLLHPFF